MLLRFEHSLISLAHHTHFSKGFLHVHYVSSSIADKKCGVKTADDIQGLDSVVNINLTVLWETFFIVWLLRERVFGRLK